MRQLWLGLTDIYNLFHTRDLTPERVAKVSKKSLEEAEAGYAGIIELRRLHVELDTAIRDAYGWHLPFDSLRTLTTRSYSRFHQPRPRFPRSRNPPRKRPRPLHHQPRSPQRSPQTPASPKPPTRRRTSRKQ